ncbi:sugar-binding protein [Pararhizobium mangrovi]|uniref:Sugar ABC transporter substrate-binding protein n=1 Tax=Pararhizobium mangrovi TaxID=2590452 RepID=A0A506U1A1_9HYPH|nr:sugar-binding protein [Pararhizobium mangrovi]TPW26715.1 sugar ABC transporter substrate-binding protein [Pararhizobium mangrovi]
MKTLITGLVAAGALAMAAAPASAQNLKTLALVVKGLDNPYFDLMHQGCERANKELKENGYTCYYTGPATAADEGAEVQIVDDLLTKGVAAIAISPSNAPAIAQLLKRRKTNIPVITADADFLKKDRDLRKAFVGTDNHELGVDLAKQLKKHMAKGGKICLVLGNSAAANINERAAGTRDELSGKEGTEKLTGQNGWTEISGCPLYTDDDAAKGNQMMADTLTANPDLDAFVLEGGWPLFAPQAYTQVTNPIKGKIESGDFVIVSADTLEPEMQALKDHRVNALVGQRPEQMGYDAAMTMMKLAEGKSVENTIYTGLDTCTWDNADNCLKGSK